MGIGASFSTPVTIEEVMEVERRLRELGLDSSVGRKKLALIGKSWGIGMNERRAKVVLEWMRYGGAQNASLINLSRALQPVLEIDELVEPAWLINLSDRTALIPGGMLSDSHWDERVLSEKVGHLNGYGRVIGVERLRTFFRNLVRTARSTISRPGTPGIVLALAGDLFSGNIHPDLRETNEDEICGSVLYWLEHVVEGVEMLRREFGKVFIPIVPGNHTRTTLKPLAKSGIRDNFDWLFGQLLAREFRRDTDVSIRVSSSYACTFRIFSTRFLLIHGNQLRSDRNMEGQLVGMLGGSRCRYQVVLMGHRHTLSFTDEPQVIVNGTMKGYDEISLRENRAYQKPRQAYWNTDRVKGVVERRGLEVMSEGEPWMERATQEESGLVLEGMEEELGVLRKH